jgi:hypothetical protein
MPLKEDFLVFERSKIPIHLILNGLNKSCRNLIYISHPSLRLQPDIAACLSCTIFCTAGRAMRR